VEQDNNREETSLRTLSRLQILHEVAFSLNLVTAAGYALLVYIYKNNLDYYLRRTAIKVDDLLHLSRTNAVTTEALRRNSQNLWNLQVGIELTIFISVFAALMIVLLILRLSGTTRMYRLIVGKRFSGLAALFAVPFSYLCLWKIVWQTGSNAAAPSLSGHPLFWRMFTADILCICALFLIPIASSLNVDNRYSPDSALCILASCFIATPIHELSDRECSSPAAPSSGVPFLGNGLAASYEGGKGKSR
jgi:hypothetical protein